MILDKVYFTNLLSHDDEPDWKVKRFPYTDSGALTIAALKVGMLIKFDATAAAVLGAVAADDAVLAGIVVDLPDNTDVPSGTNSKTVAVALMGSFDKNQIDYADGTMPISVAGITRLRSLGIFLDPATPAGAFAP
jgi:hypothetical protein